MTLVTDEQRKAQIAAAHQQAAASQTAANAAAAAASSAAAQLAAQVSTETTPKTPKTTQADIAAEIQSEAVQAAIQNAYEQQIAQKTLSPTQREALFTANTEFAVTYKDEGVEKTETFKNLGDAQQFANLQAQKNAEFVINYMEGNVNRRATFKTASQAGQFIERLTGTSEQARQELLKPRPGTKGTYIIADIVKDIESTGAKMQSKAIEAKMEGRDIEAGLLTTTGALYRFGWGLVAWPLHIGETVATVATKPGAIVESALADPVVTAMNLAVLGYSATQIAKALNTKFGITNKAYAAKIGDAAFEIVTKEDKMFYYPPETQAGGYELFDFESYKPMKRSYIANFDAGGSLDLDMSDWNRIAFERDVAPDVYVNTETWTPNLVTHAAGPTIMSLQFDANGNPYLDFGAMKNSQVNSLAAMKEYYKMVLGEKGSGAATETLLEVSQAEGVARPTYALINYTPTGVTITSEVGVIFIPVVQVKQKYDQTTITKLSDAQVIMATPILMNLIVDPLIREKHIERLNDKTINAVFEVMSPKAIETTIQGLSTDTVSDLATRLDLKALEKIIPELSPAQLTETFQSLTEDQISEVVPLLTTAQVNSISNKLSPRKREILLRVAKKRGVEPSSKPSAEEDKFVVTFTDYGGRVEVLNVKASTFREAYWRAFHIRRWHGLQHIVDIFKKGKS
jgi:hypothetical protein